MNAPVSVEGQVAWGLLTTGAGQWLRAGMGGRVVGLDFGQCFARPSAAGADPAALEWLLAAGEAGALEAISRAAEQEA